MPSTTVTSLFGLSGSWRDQLVTASFRGVEFYVKKTSSEFGRKVRMSNFYGTDYSYIEDLGASTDGYTIEGYIIANKSNNYNYFEQRDQLIDALKTGEAGTDNFVKSPVNNKIMGAGGVAPTKGFAKGKSPVPGKLMHPYYGEILAYLKEPAKIEESFEEGGICRFQATFVPWQESKYTGTSVDYKWSVDMAGLTTFNSFIDSFSGWMSIGGSFV
jgi:prophage DNA circulation protein